MKYLQMLLIGCMVTAALSAIYGCAPLGQDETELRMGGEPREYPQVPDDYPFPVVWLLPEEEKLQIPQSIFENMVLMDRAQIKLWKSGDHDFVGAHLSNEIFFPKYSDVAYVKWDEHEKPDGTIYRSVSRVLTSGENDNDMIMDQLNNGETPPGIKIVDIAEAGIDINEFLSK